VPNPALATDYKSPTAEERVQWVIHSTLGPASLIGGGISAGFGTWVNAPHEYGTHWDGFAQRYGMRTAGVATSNIMEAGIGSLTGEDPRYQRAPGDASFKKRVGHVVAWTFIAPNRDGDMHFAYARLAGIAGSNALSNTWRVESEANTSHFLERTALGFLSHMAGNTWDEFWPDAKRKMFHHGSTYDPGH
jgi:hypothetical protein